MLTPVTITRLEKAAVDNGFDLDIGRTVDWLHFGSSQTSMQIWLTAVGESLFLVAASRSDVLDALVGLGVVFTNPLPSGAAGARTVSEIAALHRLLRRAFQLSRTLPDELLHVFDAETKTLPRATEAERLVIQRVGHDIFRRGLMEYWDGRCAITGLSVPDLLRASHIKPWADCEGDAERLDVFNGLLLGAQSRHAVHAVCVDPLHRAPGRGRPRARGRQRRRFVRPCPRLRIRGSRGRRKIAVVAVARHLLRIAYYILRDGTTYDAVRLRAMTDAA